jgi:hypothetical protein
MLSRYGFEKEMFFDATSKILSANSTKMTSVSSFLEGTSGAF